MQEKRAASDDGIVRPGLEQGVSLWDVRHDYSVTSTPPLKPGWVQGGVCAKLRFALGEASLLQAQLWKSNSGLVWGGGEIRHREKRGE
jgi:hypothetical protein